MVRLPAMVSQAPEHGFEHRARHYVSRVNTRLDQALTSDGGIPEQLVDAMRYSVLGPGKRVRPLLTYASGELFGLAAERIDSIAVAVELVHAYSLIHDDLPAMDDDDVRRGRPTTHRKYGEAMAILAGDALQARAFEVLCQDLAGTGATGTRVIGWLAAAAGPTGMVGGQVLDLQAEGRRVDEAVLANIHRRKTGALIRAAIMMPRELADTVPETIRLLDEFADNIGLAFQIRDDLLEVDSDAAEPTRRQGRKSTYRRASARTAPQASESIRLCHGAYWSRLGDGALRVALARRPNVNRARNPQRPCILRLQTRCLSPRCVRAKGDRGSAWTRAAPPQPPAQPVS